VRFLAKENTDYVLMAERQFTSEVWMYYGRDYWLVNNVVGGDSIHRSRGTLFTSE